MKQQIPGVAGAVCRGPCSATNGCSFAGRGPENNRSHACEPIEVTADRFLPGSRNPIARTNPEMSANPSCTAVSPPSSMMATRKIAAGVSGARMGCG
ncbi:dyp-type peroxidase domain protein [Mycobacterium kansasii]|uniref:Dyp-type peroxidase domain protein n=1 Tax=Mycobacterium kansasii TaxID=1768 RepID=A0A1V3WUS5_MYCKA|nr:dyp-type peroxidase domain protein [Mycobacterium kansasii]